MLPEKDSHINIMRERNQLVNKDFNTWLASAHVATCRKYAGDDGVSDHVPPFIEAEALEKTLPPSRSPALVRAIIQNVQNHGILALAQLNLEPVLLGRLLRRGIFTLDGLELAMAEGRCLRLIGQLPAEITIKTYRQELQDFFAGSNGSDQ